MSAAEGEASADCLKCAHYFITHDAAFPYGCRAMNFKSRRLPRIEVEAASNTLCLAFRQKVTVTGAGRAAGGKSGGRRPG